MTLTNKKKLLLAVIAAIIVLSLAFTLNTTIQPVQDDESDYETGSDGGQTISVLIYEGPIVDQECVDGIEDMLDYANNENLVPGYYFTYSTSPTISAETLKSYDVLVMPGGDDYIDDDGDTIEDIDVTAIQNFVKNGGGYLGLCAGAFSGANNTFNCYKGWGVAPNVNCQQPYAEETTTIHINSQGAKILGEAGEITTLYWNGPAMEVSGDAFVMASYNGITDSEGEVIISEGEAAIVGDYYGQGRTALIGPHPELDPQSPTLIANLIKWLANPE